MELPAVALFRKQQLRALSERVLRLGTGVAADGGDRSCKNRKLAWDVMNKLIWKKLASAPRSSGRGERLSNGEEDDVDAVIPFHIDCESLGERVRSAYPRASPSAPEVASLARDFSDAAAAVAAYAERQTHQWWQRLEGGRVLSDRNLGVSLHPHPTLSNTSQLQYACGDSVEVVELWTSHVEALRAAHRKRARTEERAHTPLVAAIDEGLVLSHMFAMVLRYDAFSEYKCAYQAAVPSQIMQLLQRELAVAHECYASPLNRQLSSFGSAFPDTDRAFGSLGSFFDFYPTAGSFECNPPFDYQSITACLTHVLRLLNASDDPLSFVVTVPTIKRGHGGRDPQDDVCRALDSYRSAAVEVDAHGHVYQIGLQHRRSYDGSRFWRPELASTAYVWQNAAGRLRWPVRDALLTELRDAWNVSS